MKQRMADFWKALMCRIGKHKWQQSRAIRPIDYWPPPTEKYIKPTRWCKRCGKEQEWLPGYGGSELGCWY